MEGEKGPIPPDSHNAQPPYPQVGYAPLPQNPGGYPPNQGYPPQGYAPVPQGGPPPQGYAYNAQGQAVQGQYPNPGYPAGQAYPVGQAYPAGPGPVTNLQPGGVPGAPPGGPPMVGGGPQFMARPAVMPGVPAGLEYLAQIDQLLVHQQVELFELLTNWETSNRYQVKNSVGQQVYFAAEESNSCARQCCGARRGFTMHITDNLGQEVIRVRRPFKCCAGATCCASCDCCAMGLEVEAPVGQVIGSVKQQCSVCSPTYDIFGADGNKVLGVEGPMCFCQTVCCPADIEFKVKADGGQQIGKISKQWGGFAKEAITMADNFGVTFPRDLDVRVKAILLATVFLIDFMYFEQKQNKQNQNINN